MTSLPHGMRETRPGFAWEFDHLVQVFCYLVDFIFLSCIEFIFSFITEVFR